MTTGVAEASEAPTSAEYRTTETLCLLCVTTLPLDDEKPKTGEVRWRITARARLTIGTAVSFHCPNGHSSEQDPHLLKAFPSRRF
jgi:hypothetical protein